MKPIFKYHNILLPGLDATIHPMQMPFEHKLETSIVLDWLQKKYPQVLLRSAITILDLGALEGGYAVALAQAGFNVTILEARVTNIEKCRWINERLGLHMRIIQGDAKHFIKTAKFEVILCLGLLYHFDNPVEFLHSVPRSTQTLILNTHYALEFDALYDRSAWQTRIGRFLYKRFPEMFSKVHYNLSSLQINEGCAGRWFKEYDPNASKETIEHSREAAFSNARSFWLLESNLVWVLQRWVHFSRVTKIYDKPGHDRGIYVCER